MAIDYERIKEEAVCRIQELLERWLPDGEVRGHDYQALNPTRDDQKKGSFQISIIDGKWIDFATGDKGGDLISLKAYLTGCRNGEAALAVANELGIDAKQETAASKRPMDLSDLGKTGTDRLATARSMLPPSTNPPTAAKQSKRTGPPIMPVPEDASPFMPAGLGCTAPVWNPNYLHAKRYTPSHLWTYYDQDGRLLGHVFRIDKDDGDKITMPATWCSWPDGTYGWAMRWFSKPRPIFGIERLSQYPESPVLIVEGEKAATAAQQRWPNGELIATTSPCGSNSVRTAAWSPLRGRRCIIWPDNDSAGKHYALDVAEELESIGAEQIAIVDLDQLTELLGIERLPKGFDAADIPEAVSSESLYDLIMAAKPLDGTAHNHSDHSDLSDHSNFSNHSNNATTLSDDPAREDGSDQPDDPSSATPLPDLPDLPDTEAILQRISQEGQTDHLMESAILLQLGRLKAVDRAAWLRFMTQLDGLELPLRKRDFNAAVREAEAKWTELERLHRKQQRKKREAQEQMLGVTPRCVMTTSEFHHIVRATKAALAAHREQIDAFACPQGLATVSRDSADRATLYPLQHARLKELISRVVSFMDDEGRTRHPPGDVVQCIWEMPPDQSPFRPLQGVSSTALMRPDGTVASKHGYDPRTRIWFDEPAERPFPQVADEPTEAQLTAAVELLRTPFKEFTWDDGASEANAMAAIFTMALRPMIRGPTPLFIINASTPGTGKGLLTDLLCTIGTGEPARGSAPPATEEEWSKTIPALLSAGARFILFDNVGTVLSSASLDCALTMWPDYKSRPFGRNDRMLCAPNDAVWLANGNNVVIGGDLTRRCVKIGLRPSPNNPVKPEEAKFQLSEVDLRRWVNDHQADLLGAALTIARAWVVSGSPPAKQEVILGSFGEWSRIVGGVLEYGGWYGFMQNRQEAFAGSDENVEEQGFIAALANYYHESFFTTPEIARLLMEADDGREPGRQLVRDAMPPRLLIARDKGIGNVTRSVARLLKKMQDRVLPSGLQLVKSGDDRHNHRAFWKLRDTNLHVDDLIYGDDRDHVGNPG